MEKTPSPYPPLTITIKGPPKSGKTWVALALEEWLRTNHRAAVKIECDVNDAALEQRALMPHRADKFLKNRQFTITEQQSKREG